VAAQLDRSGIVVHEARGTPRRRSGAPGYRLRAACALAVLLSFALGAPARAQDFDAALYAELLLRHTREVADPAGTRVDYPGIAASADWRRLLAQLDASDPSSLRSRQEKLAFWINAYNVLAIDLVARHPGIASIREIGSLLRPVWKREAGRVAGKPISLDEIEHGILRKLGEPRVHAAIVCASVSCPSLRREPWDAARLGAQLDGAVRRLLASPAKGLRLDRAEGILWLSSIFDWFEGDFEPEGVLAFVSRHLPESDRAFLQARRPRIRYLDYDWRVNALIPPPA
jgi:hypothetical protein